MRAAAAAAAVRAGARGDHTAPARLEHILLSPSTSSSRRNRAGGYGQRASIDANANANANTNAPASETDETEIQTEPTPVSSVSVVLDHSLIVNAWNIATSHVYAEAYDDDDFERDCNAAAKRDPSDAQTRRRRWRFQHRASRQFDDHSGDARRESEESSLAGSAPTLLHMLVRFWRADQVRDSGVVLLTLLQHACQLQFAASNDHRRLRLPDCSALVANPLVHTSAATVDQRGLDMLEFLVKECGADINQAAPCESGGTPLFSAIRNARQRRHQYAKPDDGRSEEYNLVTADENRFMDVDDDNSQAAQHAAYDAAIIRSMIDLLGVSIEARDDMQTTPLMTAAGNDVVDVVRMLVGETPSTADSVGPFADTSSVDSAGNCALAFVRSADMARVLGRAMKRQDVPIPSSLSAVPVAIRQLADLELLRTFHFLGVDMNARYAFSNNETAAIIASDVGDLGMLRFLHQTCNVSMSEESGLGISASDAAAIGKHWECFVYLRDSGLEHRGTAELAPHTIPSAIFEDLENVLHVPHLPALVSMYGRGAPRTANEEMLSHVVPRTVMEKAAILFRDECDQ